jgi:PAS domain S-box-containing protein
MGKAPKPPHSHDQGSRERNSATSPLGGSPPGSPSGKQPGISAESARQLFDFVQNATDMLYTHDLTGDFTWVNPAACRIFGYTYEEAIKLNMVDVVAPEHWGIAREMAARKLEGELVASQYEITLIAKDGRRIPAEVSTQLAVENGVPFIQGIARDISDRKKAEQEALIQKAYLEELFEHAPEAIVILDVNGHIQRVNREFTTMFGYAAVEAAGKPIRDLIVPVEFAEESNFFSETTSHGGVVSRETRRRRKDGSLIDVSVLGTPIRLGSNHLGIYAIYRDISARKQAEEAVRRSEQHYRTVIEDASDIISILDGNGNVRFVSPSLTRLLGYQTEELIGRSGFSIIHPDDVGRAQSDFAQVRTGADRDAIEIRLRHKSGHYISFEAAANRPKGDRMSGSMVVIVRDITERLNAQSALRDSEAQYRLLFERNLAGVFRSTLDGRFVDCNDSFARMYGYASREDVLGRSADEFYPSTSDRPAFVARLRQTGVLLDYESHGRRKDGSDVWVLENVTLVRGENGQPDLIQGSMVDITARKRSEQVLAESETKFRAVAETAASAIYIHDGKRFLYVNHASELISGHSREELLRMDPFELVHPDSREELRRRTMDRMHGSSVTPSLECKIINKQGKPLWVELSATSIQFEGGQAVLATLFDITERKQAEKLQSALYRIAEESSRAKNLDDLFPVLHGIVSELMYAKNFYIALYDRTNQTVRFPYFVDEAEEAPVGDMPVGKGLTEYVLRTGKPLLFSPEAPDSRKQLGLFQPIGPASVDWLGVPLKKEGVAFGVLAVQSYTEKVRFTQAEVEILNFVSQQVANALERKRAEDALRESELRNRSLVQSAVYGIYRSSLEDRFLDVNPALVAMLGYGTREEVLQLNLARDVYVEAEERARLVQQYQRSEQISGVEVRWKRRDQKPIIVRLSGRACVDQHGNTVYFEMIAEDVTERRALEEQLRQSQKMEAVGRLAGGVAHDFNNLLTVIRGYSELMLSQLGPGQPLQAEIEEVRKAADRAALLTQQLLAFSRKQVLAPKILDLNAVITNMDRLMRRLLGEDVKLITKLDSNLGRTKADPGQIEQVIMNLAVNARDAMPEGGTVSIETSNVVLDEFLSRDFAVTPGPYVMLGFSDTGHGMNAETRARVFEPFFTTKEQGKGTGLGLSTVYGIVKQSGGYIWVYSEPGLGTTFKVYLPMAQEKAETRPSDASPAAMRRGSETILLVEDEDGVRTLIKQLLQRQGYVVIETRHGVEAMLECERHPSPIHLLLTDVVLTQMNGRELAQKLLPMRPEMKVLFMSGYSEEAIAHHGVLNPGTEFLQKPFTTETLIRKVREMLDAARNAAAAGK